MVQSWGAQEKNIIGLWAMRIVLSAQRKPVDLKTLLFLMILFLETQTGRHILFSGPQFNTVQIKLHKVVNCIFVIVVAFIPQMGSDLWWLQWEWPPLFHIFKCLVPSSWNCLGRIRRCYLIGGDVWLKGWTLKFQKTKQLSVLNISLSPSPTPSNYQVKVQVLSCCYYEAFALPSWPLAFLNHKLQIKCFLL